MDDDDSARVPAVLGILGFLLILVAAYKLLKHCNLSETDDVVSDRRIRNMTIDKFLEEIIIHEKPFRFKRAQIGSFTSSYSTRLGAGRFGTVFKGALPNGLAVAVKVLHRGLDIEEEQFMAAVGTMWNAHHVNLVRLFGFCFHDNLRALVFEYMELGALDAYLLDQGRDVGLPALRDIAIGVARGIRYLHEECKEKIVHYDIKLSNVLLDDALTPKVADTGLTRLVSAETHITAMPGAPGTHVTLASVAADTPGYVAPELRIQPDITEKGDVYSFGMLLLEIFGRKRIFDEAAPEGQQWFPKLAWTKYESGNLMDLVVVPSSGHTVLAVDDDLQQWKELAERMCKVAFWCVQLQPAARPPMGDAVKMLEGEMDIAPPVNPFEPVLAAPVVAYLRTAMTSTGNTTTTRGGNTATPNGGPDGSEVIDALLNVIQIVTQSDS